MVPLRQIPWPAGTKRKRNIVQPAAFIIDPERNILNVTYTSGPIGRLQVKDALGLVGLLRVEKDLRNDG